MSERWTCPVPGCNEELTACGPSLLSMDIVSHYKVMHPNLDALTNKLKSAGIPHTWSCPKYNCPSPDVQRMDETALSLAIIGHDRFYHWRQENELVGPQHVQDKNSVAIPMHGGVTADDIKLLAGMKIIW